MKISTEILRRT